MVLVVPCGVDSGAEFVVGVEAQLQVQVDAAELALFGTMVVVGSVVVAPDHDLGEMVEEDVTVIEVLVLPEVADSQEHQAAADIEAEKPMQRGGYTLQEWA